MRSTLSLIPLLLVLGSCGSPPKPPTVDESLKRPANSAMAVDLQVCKSDLQNTRILATESSRLAESAAATLERVSARQQAIAAVQAATPAAAPANSVFTIRFGFGSTRVVVPADTASGLVESARSAPLVLLRGRTDGPTDAPGESRIARERANAVRDYLVSAGVDPERIRATYQPAGDHAADNSSPSGKGMNRRVEIEVYRAVPVAMSSSAAAMP
jgi:outer membrane protein OmpA-like peptidoglycan-associated protein